MQDIQRIISFDNLYGIISRRRWYIIIPTGLFLIIGIYLLLIRPRTYEAETLILVFPQKVPQSYVRPLTNMDINSRIGSITQQIRSRSNLEKVIKEFNLFSDRKSKKMYPEDKIRTLNRQIRITVRSSRGQDSFAITYQGQEPETVMKITNKLATMFIDENLKIKEEQTIGTDIFLDSQLTEMRKKLEKTEGTLLQYRQKYMGELPENLNTNLSMLSQKKQEMSEKQAALRQVKTLLSQTEMQMSTMTQIEVPDLQSDDSLSSSDEVVFDTYGELSRVDELKNQLEDLKLRYTERHPDVIRLKDTIEKLEAKEKIEQKIKEEETILESEEEGTSLPQFDFTSVIKAQHDELKNELQQLNKEIAELQLQIRRYERRIENTEKRDQELVSISRDYDNVKSAYNSLLKKKLDAEIAVNLEKKQKGDQFRILDYAEIPEKPISPSPKKFLLLSLAAGLGIGAGLIYVLEFLSTSIKQQEDLELDLGIAVLATVPKIYHQKDKFLDKLNFALTICSVVIIIFLFCGFAIFALNGIDPTIEYVQKFAQI